MIEKNIILEQRGKERQRQGSLNIKSRFFNPFPPRIHANVITCQGFLRTASNQMFTKFPNLIFSCFFFFYTVFRILSSINKVRIYHEARIKGRYVLNGRKLSVQRFTLNTFLFHHFFFFLHLFFSRFLSSSSHLLFHLHSLSSSLSSLL